MMRRNLAIYQTTMTLLLATSASAANLYWDENGNTAGFGTASGTWSDPTPGPTVGWSTNDTGTATINSLSTTTGDRLYFGTATTGLGSGTVTVSGSVDAQDLFFGNASGDITLDGGSIAFGAGGVSNIRLHTSDTVSTSHTINSDINKPSGSIQLGTQQTTGENFILNGVISGAAGMIARPRNNAGVFGLYGLNTFSGNFSHVTGQINANTIADGGVASSLGAGSVYTMGGGGGQQPFLWYTGAAATSSDRTFRSNASGAVRIVAQDGALDLTGSVTTSTAGNRNIRFAGTADTGVNTVSGVISDGPGTLEVILNSATPQGGTGEEAYWRFSGNNSYSGRTLLNTGTLVAGHTNALGVGGPIQFDGGTLSYEPGVTTDWSARVSNSSEAIKVDTASGEIVTWTTTLSNSNTGGLIKEGDGTLRIAGGGGNYSGDTTVNGGNLQIRNTADLAGFSSANFFVNNGSTLAFQSSVGGSNRQVLNNKTFTFDSNGGGTINLNGGNFLFQGGGSTHNFFTTGGTKNTIASPNNGFMNMQGAGTINFTVADGSDDWDLELSATFQNGSIVKNGAGTMAITRSTIADFGNNTIEINEGTLEIAGNAALRGGSFTNDIINNATFKYSSSENQTLNATFTGTGNLEKTGGATLTLAGTTSHSGSTVVHGGLILFNGDGSGASGDLTINSSATLGGTGSVGGNTTIADGGMLAPGDGGVGTLTLSLGLDVSGAAASASPSMLFDLGPSVDQVSMSGGTLEIGTGLFDLDDFAFNDLGITPGSYVLFDAGSISGSLGSVLTKDLSATHQASLSIDVGNNDIVLGINVIPEPGNLALLGMGAFTLLGRFLGRRSRR